MGLCSCRLIVLLGLFWYCHGCFAWSARIHGEISLAVYQQLAPAQQRAYERLADHLWQSYADIRHVRKMPAACGMQPAVCFLGYWPDTEKAATLNTLMHPVPPILAVFAGDNTARWHYTNNFYDIQTLQPVGGCKNSGLLTDVIGRLILALAQSESEHNTAVSLSMLVHLLADAHQPLHTFSLADKQCQHDAGGNGVCLEFVGNTCVTNLHQLWDSGAGAFGNTLLGKKYQLESALSWQGDSTLERWIDESQHLRETIYRDPRSAAYQAQVRAISTARVQLAIARLSALLNTLKI